MASFTVDYSKANQRYNVQDGEYEVIIKGVAFNMTAGGTEYISVKTRVRDDYKQPEQGESIEYPLWKSRPENSKSSDIEGVPAWKIHQLSKAAQLPEGTTIDAIDDWFKALQDKPIRVTTKQDDQGRAKVVRVEESMAPAPKPAGFTPVDTSEELPF